MILPLLAVLQLAQAESTYAVLVRAQDSVPRVTLSQAIKQAANLDPNYVQALGQVDEEEWGYRAARLAFVLPAVTATLDATRYSDAFFNIGTGQVQSSSVVGTLQARYEIFSLRKLTDLSRTSAQLEGARAGTVQAQFISAFQTESDFYATLADQELLRVARDRAQRADTQLAVARARVVSGAAVQTDSLQLFLELTRAQVDVLQRTRALTVSRLQLGRRIGVMEPVEAVASDTLPAPELPITLPEAITRALTQRPGYRIAVANARAAQAILSGRKGEYLPTFTLGGTLAGYDDSFFPSGRTVSWLTLGVSFPIWNNGLREIGITQARVDRDVAQSIRADFERAAAPNVTEAYMVYDNARATTALATQAVIVAQENYRVQETRYRSGATTILELLEAQVSLSDAQAGVVQARYANRLALAGLEALLGERLFPIE